MRTLRLWLLITALAVSLSPSVYAQLADITQPGDPIVGTSANTPGSEGVANAIDNQPTKYLNFDRLNTGFTVTPRVGLSVVQCITLTSANDAPERDPATYELSGSYDGTNFTVISAGAVPAFPARFWKNTVCFDNNTPYLIYRLIFPEVVGPGGNSMQIAEVELLGFLAPTDVTQPGDPIVGTSANTPGSEGVANAIDNQPTKYLNFDRLNTGFTVTPSVGGTLVSGLTLTSANDAPERDPASYTLEGSYDGTNFFSISSGAVPAFPARFYKNYIFFSNSRAFRSYRLIFPTVVGPGGNSMQISEVELLGVVSDLPQDVTQPGDPIVGTSANTPGSEGVANAIDNQPTKYLNFDRLNTGFTVSPRSGLTIVNGLTLTSANDAPERDPATYALSGSYDGSNFVAISSGTVPAFPSRFFKNTILFDNKIPYLHYRLIFPEVVGPGGNSMQIAEVELLGVLAPTDVTVPGDPIVGTSANTPGSEGVANAIDNQPTKYLNFDRLNTGFTVTPGVGDTILSGLSFQSANDAPERDPATYALSGSIDGSNFVAISSGAVPAFPTRFYRNYVFFPENTKAFKSYRLIFPTVVGPGGNSMQIAEVEFLGVTPGVVNTNPVDTLIRRQPSDTPVLLGSSATFRIQLTGPWKVQWYRDGTKIPGATTTTYTTPPVTAADDGALFKAVVQAPSGVQTSDEVMLSVFTPSATESIGLSWQGSGANGAPTAMLPSDITGFHLQAYWNNLAGGAGTLASPVTSANAPHPTISFTWATSGEWGAGTGNGDPTERMFNGMCTSTATTEANAQTVTFSGVPAGSHSVLLYTVQVPLEFFNMDFAAVTFNSDGTEKAVQRRFIRPLNSDEYNPSPGFVLVTATSAAERGVGNMIRFDNLQTDDGRIQIRFFSPGRAQPPNAEPIRGPGVNGMQLVLNPPPVGDPPVITRQPVSANGIVGGQVTLLVEASGPNLTYQWFKNGQPIDGATNPTLTLQGLRTNDVGNYFVAIANPTGRVRSRTAVVDVLSSGAVTLGLSTYFKFDETEGAVASNSVAGGANGELQGFFQDWGPGQIDNAIYYDGVTHVFVPTYPKPGKSFTVGGWVLSTDGVWGPLVNNWVAGRPIGLSGQFLLEIVNDPANAPFQTLRGVIEVSANKVTVSGPIDATSGEWHHFALAANGVTLSIYFDGQLVGATDYLGSINTGPDPWLSIGATFTDPPGTALPTQLGTVFGTGAMDDIALWNRYLSDVEIQGVYTAGLSGKNVSQVPPILNINRSPVANDDTSTVTGASAIIDVLANDTDADAGDVLTISSVTVPAHGSASITTNNTVLYRPAPGYSGPDAFRYTIGDGHGGIASANVTVTVTAIPPTITCPGNITAECTGGLTPVTFTATAVDSSGAPLAPVCVPPSGTGFRIGTSNVVCTATDNSGLSSSCSFTVTVADTTPPQVTCPGNITTPPTSPAGAVVTYTASASDPCGLSSFECTPPSGSTFPMGVTAVTCSATDEAGLRSSCTFTVTVAVLNNPPVADASASQTNAISGNNSNAVVHLDGTRSSDPDGDPLTYAWFVDGGVVPVATGPTADVTLEVGDHTVTLVVDDGLAHASATIHVTVLTAGEAVDNLITRINEADLGRKNKRPFIASLKAAMASLDRGSFESGENQLHAFQNKVRAQIGRTDPALAAQLIAEAQAIIDALAGP